MWAMRDGFSVPSYYANRPEYAKGGSDGVGAIIFHLQFQDGIHIINPQVIIQIPNSCVREFVDDICKKLDYWPTEPGIGFERDIGEPE